MSWRIETLEAGRLQEWDTMLTNSVLTVDRVERYIPENWDGRRPYSCSIFFKEGPGSLGCDSDYPIQVLLRGARE